MTRAATASRLSFAAEGLSGEQTDGDGTLCPESRSIGIRVGLITVKALLTADALRRLDGKAYRFCLGRDCDVVYFDRAANSVFRKGDLRVRVGQKETEDPIPLCYCFDVSVADLRQQIAVEGKTDIPASVAAEVKAGRCACEVRNPQGSCCLGALSTVVERLSSQVSSAEP